MGGSQSRPESPAPQARSSAARTPPGIVEFGCPHGSLCQELEKIWGPMLRWPGQRARLLTTYIDWAKEQLRSFGFATGEARELATELVACIQGTMLLAHTLRSREVLSRQLRRVEGWLEDQLSPPGRRSMNLDLTPTILSDRITEFRTAMAGRAPPEVLATLDDELKKLADSGIAQRALQVGAKAPDFTLPNAQGGSLTLSALTAKGPVVLTFIATVLVPSATSSSGRTSRSCRGFGTWVQSWSPSPPRRPTSRPMTSRRRSSPSPS